MIVWRNLLEKVPPLPEVMPLPDPVGKLTVEALVVVPPKAEVPAVRNVNLDLEPGEALGIVGPSASGKSTLARALLGIWPVFNGNVRLDGANIAQWDREARLVLTLVICRKTSNCSTVLLPRILAASVSSTQKVVEAAKLAGVHELVLQLPEGYDTRIGSMGGALSGGQRQRVALARAVYNNPRLVVLDEPNSNLDDQGEKALINTVLKLKQNKSTIVISHRVAILHVMDKMLILNEGQTVEFGPKEKVLATLTAPRDARQNTPGGQTAGN